MSLEGFGSTWKPGNQLIDVEITLGQNEKSSSCTVMLSDALGLIAAALINHTIAHGGIQALAGNAQAPEDAPTAAMTTPSTSSSAVPVSRGSGFTPQVLAFMDLIAHKESNDSETPQSYYSLNGLGFYDPALGLKGFPNISGSSGGNVGRYQFSNRASIGTEFDEFQRATGAKDYSPQSQDLMVIWRMKSNDRGWNQLMGGDIRGAIKKAGFEWASLPGSPYNQVQEGYTVDQAIAYYNKRLALHSGGIGNVDQATKVDPKATKVDPKATPLAQLRPDVTKSSPEPVVKGNKITIDIDQFSFEFFHQGTSHNESGITTVTGQGIRWILNRRKRNKTIKDTSLKQLAQAITTAHNIKLDWSASYDPTYEHIDQSGISDYQLLVRECTFAGLWVSETSGTPGTPGKPGKPGALTVKSRDKIVDTGFVVDRGLNLKSYKFDDKALDKSKEASPMLQDEPKATVEPITGKISQKLPDIDHVKDKSTTGTQSPVISGTTKPGQDALLTQNRAKMKRLMGLPSQFVIIQNADSLALKPHDAVRTISFPEPLNRIWLIDKVTHKISDDTTTLEVYSPIDVVNDSPSTEAPTPATPTTPIYTKGWVYPCNGTVTSGYGERNTGIPGASTFHKAIDIANATGTPILAALSGTVVQAVFAEGAGNLIKVRHDNGYHTRYLHNTSFVARVGQQVKTGEIIALMGHTGIGSGSHCHFEVHNPSGDKINPVGLFPKLGVISASIIGGAPV